MSWDSSPEDYNIEDHPQSNSFSAPNENEDVSPNAHPDFNISEVEEDLDNKSDSQNGHEKVFKNLSNRIELLNKQFIKESEPKSDQNHSSNEEQMSDFLVSDSASAAITSPDRNQKIIPPIDNKENPQEKSPTKKPSKIPTYNPTSKMDSPKMIKNPSDGTPEKAKRIVKKSEKDKLTKTVSESTPSLLPKLNKKKKTEEIAKSTLTKKSVTPAVKKREPTTPKKKKVEVKDPLFDNFEDENVKKSSIPMKKRKNGSISTKSLKKAKISQDSIKFATQNPKKTSKTSRPTKKPRDANSEIINSIPKKKKIPEEPLSEKVSPRKPVKFSSEKIQKKTPQKVDNKLTPKSTKKLKITPEKNSKASSINSVKKKKIFQEKGSESQKKIIKNNEKSKFEISDDSEQAFQNFPKSNPKKNSVENFTNSTNFFIDGFEDIAPPKKVAKKKQLHPLSPRKNQENHSKNSDEFKDILEVEPSSPRSKKTKNSKSYVRPSIDNHDESPVSLQKKKKSVKKSSPFQDFSVPPKKKMNPTNDDLDNETNSNKKKFKLNLSNDFENQDPLTNKSSMMQQPIKKQADGLSNSVGSHDGLTIETDDSSMEDAQ